jgi:hypothetical protein
MAQAVRAGTEAILTDEFVVGISGTGEHGRVSGRGWVVKWWEGACVVSD